MSKRLKNWGVHLIKGSFPAIFITFYLVGCSSNQVRYKKEATHSFTDYRFPHYSNFQKNSDNLSNEKVIEIVNAIKSIPKRINNGSS